MRLGEYTPENICRVMGLSFAEDDVLRERGEALRIVFIPSFSPEVVVTLWATEHGLSVQVVALLRQLWHEMHLLREWRPSLVRLPEISETVTVSSPDFCVMKDAYAEAQRSLQPDRARDPDRMYTICDGMAVAACYYSSGSTDAFDSGQTLTNALKLFNRRVVEVAWSATTNPLITNALAHVGSYLGLKYPMAQIPPEPPLTRLLILGTPEGRADYFKQLPLLQKRKI